MLPPPPVCLRLAVGTGLASAATVIAWMAIEVGASAGLEISVAVLFAFALLAAFGGTVLGLLAVVWLRMYRLQTEPGPSRSRATWAVAVTLAPAVAVLGWVAAIVVAAVAA